MSLDRRLRGKAEAKQQEYRKAAQKQKEIDRQKSVISTILEQESVETKQEEQWYDFLTPERETKRKAEDTGLLRFGQEKVAKKEEPDWLSWLGGRGGDKPNEEPDWFGWLSVPMEKLGATERANGASAVSEGGVEMAPVNGDVAVAVEEAPVKERKKGILMRIFKAPVEEEKITLPKEVIVPEISAYVLPNPTKILWGGEDAVFVNGRTFGVFDGVTGAAKLDGVALYSKTMAQEMKKYVPEEGIDIKTITQAMEKAVKYSHERATGATTAIVGSIGEDGYLRVLNVGDSKCIVVRDGQVVARSRELFHFYECPYQFSTDSPDKPSFGTRLNFELAKGDFVLMGSDGIFDNLFDEKIVEIIMSTSPKRASSIAKRVSDESRKISFNPKVLTPFSQLALKNRNPEYLDGVGGKLDDVSCVVAIYE